MSTVLERHRTERHHERERDDLLGRYLRALDRHGDPEPQRDVTAPGSDVRSCAHCGETAAFRLDAAGGWAFCTACGHAA